MIAHHSIVERLWHQQSAAPSSDAWNIPRSTPPDDERGKLNALSTLPPEIARRRVIGTNDAAAFCGLSVPTFRRLNDRGAIPTPIRLSERRLGWKIMDLIEWLDCRQAGLQWHEHRTALAMNDNAPKDR